ncbi:hypothetical protein MMC13_007727 [Lambiella insularis]|nr:hypothetical protein [Lambiella insularis]
MPATDSPAVIVARFLKANHYDKTLDAFILEAGLEPDAGSIEKGDLTIEKILEEKKVFDLSVRFEKFGTGGGKKGWSLPAPSTPTIISTLPTSANLLHVSVVNNPQNPTANGHPEPTQLLLATSADRRLHILATDGSFSLLDSLTHIQDSPILSCLAVAASHLQTITASMSGQVVLYDHRARKPLDERRDHQKYVVKIATWEEDPIQPPHLLATAGWDGNVNLYSASKDPDGNYASLGEPVASITLPTNPETLLFVKDPATSTLFLIVTRRDSTSLHYYTVHSPPNGPPTLTPAGAQNLAPHSNAWIAFSPSSLALSPCAPTLLAVATSSVPHMKLLLVRLLFPAPSPPAAASATQALQTHAALERQDREEATIVLHVNTLAQQTPYSTPMVAWRPDGSGVWVNGDDGVVRGVDAQTGKVRAQLKGGHEVGSKVRSLWAGCVGEGEGRGEWVLSGGFDKRLVVWRVGEEEDGGLDEGEAGRG